MQSLITMVKSGMPLLSCALLLQVVVQPSLHASPPHCSTSAKAQKRAPLVKNEDIGGISTLSRCGLLLWGPNGLGWADWKYYLYTQCIICVASLCKRCLSLVWSASIREVAFIQGRGCVENTSLLDRPSWVSECIVLPLVIMVIGATQLFAMHMGD